MMSPAAGPHLPPGIVREIARPDPAVLMRAIAASPNPATLLQELAPDAPEYARLVKEKLRLQAGQGWGAEIASDGLGLGGSGPAVIQLRNQLIARGYLNQTASGLYDQALLRAVQRFQLDSGITADGIAGAATIAALNVPVAERLKSITVALERLRWMGDAPRGARGKRTPARSCRPRRRHWRRSNCPAESRSGWRPPAIVGVGWSP